MKDKTLLKFSLVWSIVGIILLLFIAEYSEPSKINIIDSEDNLGKTVKINGKVLSFVSKPTVTFIEIEDYSGKIVVVSFDKLERPKCSNLEVSGKVKLYKGNLEIIADSIKCT